MAKVEWLELGLLAFLAGCVWSAVMWNILGPYLTIAGNIVLGGVLGYFYPGGKNGR